MDRDARIRRAFENARAALASAAGRRFEEAFRNAFPEARLYLVGGAVRDFLLGRVTKDVDLVVRGVASPELERFLSGLGRVDFVGRTFGVFKFLPRGRRAGDPVDIALPRTEESMAGTGAYRDFRIASDPRLPIEEDLKRRDFTLNAMAFEMSAAARGEKKDPSGVLVDPFGGAADLSARRLRTVGDAAARFREDYSRMLRGVRFSCALGFEFDAETWASLKTLSGRVQDRRPDGEFVVPREIVARELILAFEADPVRALDLLDASGLLTVLLPELEAMKGCPQPPNYHSEGDVWTHTRLALARLSSPEFHKIAGKGPVPAEVVFGVLFHDVAKPATIRTPERDGTDRIRFHEHDRIGGEMVRHICDRLKLSQFPRRSLHHLDAGRLSWLVEKHLLLINDVAVMKNATIEKYFFNPDVPGRALLRVMAADILATIPAGGEPDLGNYRGLLARIRRLRTSAKDRAKLEPPLLNGREVMDLLTLEPGPRIGGLLLQLREAQLGGKIRTKREAEAYLKILARGG